MDCGQSIDAEAQFELIHVLLIEDNELDADILQEKLDTTTKPHIVIHVEERLKEGLSRLKSQRFDVMLLDLTLPDSFGLETLYTAQSAAPHIPIVILTGMDDLELGLKAVRAGAQDYLIKGEISSESIRRVIRYAIERKKNESLLNLAIGRANESEQNLKLALKTSNTGVWIWHLAEDKHEWSSEFRQIFGMPDDFSTLHDLMRIVHQDDRPRIQRALACVLEDGQCELEFQISKANDQSPRWLKSETRRVCDETGKPIKIVGTYHDITAVKEEAETKRKLSLLEQRQEFIALLAHDLKTPLRGAELVLSLIKQDAFGSVPTQVKDVLSQLIESNVSMRRMINNVMDCYRLESNSETFEIVPLCAKTVIKNCIDEIRPVAMVHNVDLQFRINTSLNLMGDSIALYRCISNLLNNAVKFTSAGGSVTVEVNEHPSGVAILVMDTGVGIAADDLNNVFERFYQGKRSYREKGLGLGLYLTRRLVNEQGGTIECRSVVGQGTTFQICLPCAPKSQAEERLDRLSIQ